VERTLLLQVGILSAALALLAWGGCEDCKPMGKFWCEEGEVKICTSNEKLFGPDLVPETVADCSSEGATCREWTGTKGKQKAGCVDPDTCHPELNSFCVYIDYEDDSGAAVVHCLEGGGIEVDGCGDEEGESGWCWDSWSSAYCNEPDGE
jgi:hypothetical protein